MKTFNHRKDKKLFIEEDIRQASRRRVSQGRRAMPAIREPEWERPEMAQQAHDHR